MRAVRCERVVLAWREGRKEEREEKQGEIKRENKGREDEQKKCRSSLRCCEEESMDVA